MNTVDATAEKEVSVPQTGDSGRRSRAYGHFVETLRSLVFPSVCCFCNQPVQSDFDFCAKCEAALTLSQTLMQSACARCGVPKPQVTKTLALTENLTATPTETPRASENPNEQQRCVHCRDLEFSFAGVTALWTYQDRVCDAIVAAKYPHHAALGNALGQRLAAKIRDSLEARPTTDCFDTNAAVDSDSDAAQQAATNDYHGDWPDLVTFVPSHFQRQFSRGGIGSEIIASAVAQQLRIPCQSMLKATRNFKKQAWLSDKERVENVRGAFAVKNRYAFRESRRVASPHILLVDDVLTTGATANEIAKTLLAGGARRVSLAVVARAIRSQ